jgi:hypothetical protein
MKKLSKAIAAGVLAAVLFASALCPAAYAATEFSDVPAGSWYHEAVQYAVDHGLFSGTGSSTFSPDQGMTRGMFVTVLGRKSAVDTAAYQGSSFADVDEDAYYAPYVEWAASYGIVSGVTADTFAPEKKITREQIAVMLYRYAQRTGNDDSVTEGAAYDRFIDSGRMSQYAIESLDWAVTHNVLNGMKRPGNDYEWMEPQKIATRAQVAQIFMNSAELLVNTDVSYPPEEPVKPKYGIDILSNGKPVTEENVKEMLYGLQSLYPQGMPNDGCTTFAKDVWGCLGADTRDYYFKYSSERPGDFDKIRPGDWIGYKPWNSIGHDVIVLEKLPDSIIVVEGNYGGWINWGREITRQELENNPDMFMVNSFYPVY